MTALGPGPRSAHQAVWGPDGRLYVFGGEFGTSKETRFLHYRDFWALDPRTWTWEALPSQGLPPARSGHRMAVWGPHWAVLYGGFIDTNGSTTAYLEDLWLYHFPTRAWRRVDWLNPELPRPSARSAFQLSASAEGLVLYGGYCQVKGRNGVPKGQVLNDLWLLRMPSPDGDLQLELRWERRKTGSTAPLPRSGCASTRLGPDTLAVFGGVFDEDVSDEFIQGTCSNELHLYTPKTNKWARAEYGLDDPAAAHGHHLLCPRFNAMMTTGREGRTVYLYGGIWEIGDVQYTLDDLYRLETAGGTTEGPFLFKVLSTISLDLSNWQEQIEAERREMMASDSSDDDGSDSDDTDTDDDDESDDDEEYEAQAFSEDGCPPINRKQHRTLKDYFDASSAHWLERARQDNPVAGEKDQRKAAFLLAKTRWDEAALVDSVERL